ncbi:MAG: cyclopropane fatty acyl phospholipid synthase [Calditrichaeota bacterium]|nr:MAG: cyclopropane fatty acyl phospholipid synthase [Calditrichota bacterium]
MSRRFRDKIERWLAEADVQINGDRPWDLVVHDERLWARVFSRGSLGAGEAYMDGWWDSPRLDEFFHRILKADLDRKIVPWREFFSVLQARLINRQSGRRAFEVGRRHYDLGNDLYQCMLDRRMIYSCAYWKDAANLDEAQEAKLDLVCRKLLLEPGLRVLDIGCGWGGTARFMAETYRVEVVGITVSRNQAEYAREVCKGLPVEIRLQDYREVRERFDRVVSIGMFEHVGYKNYRTFMEVVHRCLRPEGLFLLHTIGNNRSVTRTDPWIETYIFPNSMIPSASQIARAAEGLFVLEDWHSFGPHYDRTLMAWFHNFHRRWPEIRDRYGERFYRMWKYFLLSSAGSFRARKNQVWQIVFSPGGVPGGYPSVR